LLVLDARTAVWPGPITTSWSIVKPGEPEEPTSMPLRLSVPEETFVTSNHSPCPGDT